MRPLQSKNFPRWFLTTMHQEQRTSGLWVRTEMLSQEFCKLWSLSWILEFWFIVIGYIPSLVLCWNSLNEACYLWYRFRPRILIDVSKIDLTTTVLGFKISMPIMIAPTAMQKMAHPEGIQLFYLKFVSFFCLRIAQLIVLCSCSFSFFYMIMIFILWIVFWKST